MPYFCPFTAYFSGFEGDFSYKNDKSAILCPGKTETADFVSFKGSIVQGLNLQKILFYVGKFDILLITDYIIFCIRLGNLNENYRY